MLNSARNNSLSDLVSVYQKVFDFDNLEAYNKFLNSDFLKFRILEIFNFHL